MRKDGADPARMSVAELFEAARAELLRGDDSAPAVFLVALHERASREVFDGAVRMLSGADPAWRELGALILRELGPPGEQERRPFSDAAVPVLVDRLRRETEPRVLGWVISALGYNAAGEALAEVLPFAEHPHWRVRFHVAAAIPSLVDAERIDPRALDALRKLCRDNDADTRFYALYALVEELGTAVVAEMLDDPDEQVRDLARAHRIKGGATRG